MIWLELYPKALGNCADGDQERKEGVLVANALPLAAAKWEEGVAGETRGALRQHAVGIEFFGILKEVRMAVRQIFNENDARAFRDTIAADDVVLEGDAPLNPQWRVEPHRLLDRPPRIVELGHVREGRHAAVQHF